MSLLQRPKREEGHQTHGSADVPSTTNSEIVGHQPGTSKTPRRRSSALKFFASSTTSKPETGSPHKAWEADYLRDLRANRPTRPGGSRPQPGRATTSKLEPYIRATSALSFRPSCSTRQVDPSVYLNERPASALSHRRAQSDILTINANSLQPNAGVASRDFSPATPTTKAPSVIPSGAYRESGMRWMEKQEARSIRQALEDMDLQNEKKLRAAAQDEASELVWKHRNQGVPYKNPDRPYNYKQHLEKGAHTRSQSHGCYTGYSAALVDHNSGQVSASDRSDSSKEDGDPLRNARNIRITFAEPSKASEDVQSNNGQDHTFRDSPQNLVYLNLKTSARRRSSGARARAESGGLFRNPEDKIYEEPNANIMTSEPAKLDQSRIPVPLKTKTRNASSKVATASQPSYRPRVNSREDKTKFFRSEIHKNSPSQSRNPSYTKNAYSASSPSDKVILAESQMNQPLIKDGLEIRSDDIKAATSMRMKDRSQKLPSPTVVSDRPGRPIVSFERGWRPKDSSKQEDPSPDPPSSVLSSMRFKPHMPKSTASAPIVPTINIPSIQVDEAPHDDTTSIPTISVSDTPVLVISAPENPPVTRPLPNPVKSRNGLADRPLPHHSATTPVHSSKLHWTPSSRRATAQCAACALPIEGRIVSAASQRFHPHCFTCHHCAEPLECVAFYPETDSARAARLARIDARMEAGVQALPDEKDGETAADDGDSSLRFYCHLDYHELFSPRCRSCKTPIETEVVLACGGSWHVGHFFCAECGDPFDAKTPFVEKNGYAWCVGCHAGKFSGKCKGCKKPVVDGGVSALGAEWHVECFCCVECGGQFEDGRFFTRGDEAKPVCVACEEKRLKA